MTDFKFIPPKILVEADNWLKTAKTDDWMKPENTKFVLALVHSRDMKLEQRWNWLRENKDEIWTIELETEDTGIAFEDKAIFRFNGTSEIYEEYISLGNKRDIKKFKNKCKRFGIPTDLIVDMTLK